MRFWLSAFVFLFAITELFNWLAQIGSWQMGGVWLVLAGMGLAAASNGGAAGLLGHREDAGSKSKGLRKGEAESKKAKDKPIETLSKEKEEVELKAKSADRSIDRSDDSISFKVRPLKR